MVIVDYLVRAGVALVAILGFYRVVATNWPGNYYVLDDVIGGQVSSTLGRYLLFRFGPLFVAVILASAHVDGGVAARSVIGVLILAGHVLISIRRINPFSVAGGSHGKKWYLLQVVVFAASSVVVLVAVGVEPVIGSALPEWKDYVGAATTAVFVLILGAVVISATSRRSTVSKDAVVAHRETFGRTTDRVALQVGVDRAFANALVMIECLQRPRWFRSLERRLAWTRAVQTFGVAQQSFTVGGDVEAQIRSLLQGVGDLTDPSTGTLSRNRMILAARRLNRGAGYSEFVLDLYHKLANGSTSQDVGEDGNPTLTAEAAELKIEGFWEVCGDVNSYFDSLAFEYGSGGAGGLISDKWSGDPGRTRWRLQLPAVVENVQIVARRAADRDYCPLGSNEVRMDVYFYS